MTFSSVTVSKGTLQIESSWLRQQYTRTVYVGGYYSYLGQTDYIVERHYNILARIGLSDRLELRLAPEFISLKETRIYPEPVTSINYFGFSNIKTGFKFSIFKDKAKRFTASLLSEIYIPYPEYKIPARYSIGYSYVLLGFKLCDKATISSTFGADYNNIPAINTLFFTSNLSYSFNKKISGYLEYYTNITPSAFIYTTSDNIDMGLLYLINSQFQVDCSFGLGLNNVSGNFASIGLSYLFLPDVK